MTTKLTNRAIARSLAPSQSFLIPKKEDVVIPKDKPVSKKELGLPNLPSQKSIQKIVDAKKKEQAKAKAKAKAKSRTRQGIVKPKWSQPTGMHKVTKQTFGRYHHFSFAYENDAVKILYRYDIVVGNEMDVGKYGQYYKFSKDKAGMVYKHCVYYRKIPTASVKKGYVCKEISSKEAKALDIYQQAEYMPVEVAIKHINAYIHANRPYLRFITKFI